VAAVLWQQHLVADLHIHWDDFAVTVRGARPSGNNLENDTIDVNTSVFRDFSGRQRTYDTLVLLGVCVWQKDTTSRLHASTSPYKIREINDWKWQCHVTSRLVCQPFAEKASVAAGKPTMKCVHTFNSAVTRLTRTRSANGIKRRAAWQSSSHTTGHSTISHQVRTNFPHTAQNAQYNDDTHQETLPQSCDNAYHGTKGTS
jgi:hypothetical protein